MGVDHSEQEVAPASDRRAAPGRSSLEAPGAAPAYAEDGERLTPRAALAIQHAAGNRAVARLVRSRQPNPGRRNHGRILARAPKPPANLRRDTSKVAIKPIGTAAAPIEYAAISDETTHWADRRFTYSSDPVNLGLTWRWFDGSDNEVGHSNQWTADLAFSPDIIRDRIRSVGRSAIGTWTIRLEKDEFYDDATIDVREERPLAAMEGETTQSWFNLRDLPGGAILGTLSGASVPITVDGKAKAGGDVYYHVTLKAATGEQSGTKAQFPAGTKAWIAGQALTPVMSWDMFRAQLAAWETANSSLSLDQRITRLRQMSHKADLPFDDVIGTSSGPSGTYLDQRPYKPEDWDILVDSQMVRMPDGKVIEVQHLLVGLDVLPKAKEDLSFHHWGFKVHVGQNYSAATWAGDVGAGAADAAIRFDKEWEAHNPSATRADRTKRYYTTRLPLAELTADIDAWGIDDARKSPGAPATIEGLLLDYYGGTTLVRDAGTKGPSAPTHTPKRKAGIERFLRHYFLVYGARSGGVPFKQQTSARDLMRDQIVLFGKAWLEFRPGWVSGATTADMEKFAGDMTDMLLDEIEKLAGQVGAAP